MGRSGLLEPLPRLALPFAFFGDEDLALARLTGLVINHKDGNKLNNLPSNLEYCTYSQNAKHAFAHGLCKQKPTPRQVEKIKADLAFAPPWAVARRFGVSIENIKMIRDGKIWVDVGRKVKPMKGANRRKLFGSW